MPDATGGTTQYHQMYFTTTCTGTTASNTLTVYNCSGNNQVNSYTQSQLAAQNHVGAYDRFVSVRAQQAATLRAHKPEAKERARGMLLENLTEEQKKTFLENKWFIVEGGKSKKKYRIRDSEDMVANVDDLTDGKYLLCAHAGLNQVPVGDHLLAQKLMIEFAEDEFLKKANRHAA